MLLLFLKKPLKMSFINECQSETVEVAGFIAKTFDILNVNSCLIIDFLIFKDYLLGTKWQRVHYQRYQQVSTSHPSQIL